MCFANPFWQAPYVQNLKRSIREKISSRRSNNSSRTPSPSPPAISRPMISAPTSFYKDESRDARITMTQLTDGHDSFVQSSKSSQKSSSAPSFITASVTGGSIDRTPADLSPLSIEKAPPLSMSSPFQSPPFPVPFPVPIPATTARSTALDPSLDEGGNDGSKALLDSGAGSFVDSLQLKGARVSTMFKGMPFLRDLEDGQGESKAKIGESKRRSMFGGLR